MIQGFDWRTMKAIVIGIGGVGCLLLVYGGITQSSAAFIGLCLGFGALGLAAFVDRERPPRSGQEEKGAKAERVASDPDNH